MSRETKDLIVGLDIGTSKVTALVGEYAPDNPIEVIGIGAHEARCRALLERAGRGGEPAPPARARRAAPPPRRPPRPGGGGGGD